MNREIKLTKKVYSANVCDEWNRLTQDLFHRLVVKAVGFWTSFGYFKSLESREKGLEN